MLRLLCVVAMVGMLMEKMENTMTNRIIIYKDMTEGAKKPYRLADVYPTLDGYRTRLSHICFETYAEAVSVVMAMENHNGN